MTTAIILGSIVLLVAIAAVTYFRRKDMDLDAQERLQRDQLKSDEKNFEHREKFVLEYFGGHPQMATAGTVYLLKEDESLSLIEYKMFQPFPFPTLGRIPITGIESITVEDQTTIEERISAMRVLWVGMAAVGWKTKKVAGTAYLVINWHEGNSQYATFFGKEGREAVAEMGEIRGRLLQWCGLHARSEV